jgi:general secretion pathway protein G
MEIIIVVVLIGLLAGLSSVLLIRRAEGTKRELARVAIKGLLATALQHFYLDNNFYPTTGQGLQALVEKPSGSPEPEKYPEEGYLEEVPLDPWRVPYQYACPGTHNKTWFDLWSCGPDRQPGTPDDIVNWRTR